MSWSNQISLHDPQVCRCLCDWIWSNGLGFCQRGREPWIPAKVPVERRAWCRGLRGKMQGEGVQKPDIWRKGSLTRRCICEEELHDFEMAIWKWRGSREELMQWWATVRCYKRKQEVSASVHGPACLGGRFLLRCSRPWLQSLHTPYVISCRGGRLLR